MAQALCLWILVATSAGQAQGSSPADAIPKTAAQVGADAQSPVPGGMDLRLRMTQLVTDDLVTADHIVFTDARLTLDAVRPLDLEGTQLHVDGRWRYGWTDITAHRNDVTRLLVQYGSRDSAWMVALGRQVIGSAFAARLDGGYAGLRITEHTHAGLFAGLKPHPITAALDADFLTTGVTYDTRTANANHAGGAVVDLFAGEADRIYLTERTHLRLGRAFSVSGHAIIDFLAPRGIVDDLQLRQKGSDDFVSGIDLTNARLRVRFREPDLLSVAISAAHVHTILPNVWWRDWVREERARRGLVVDGAEPVGTRRSTMRIDSDLYVTSPVTPYLRLRYDQRHNDGRVAWEARPGVRFAGRDLRVDVTYGWRQHFSAINNHVSVATGIHLLRQSSLEAGVSVMHSRPRGERQGDVLYDFHGLLRAGLGDFAESLDGVDLIAQYQGFLDRSTVLHVFVLRLGYRLRS